MDMTTLENWLWDIACKFRGPVDASKYKDYILPLIFMKRLSDVFDDEFAEVLKLTDNNTQEAEEMIREDPSLVRFYIPEKARWKNIAKQTTNIGEYLTEAAREIAKYNKKLEGVIDLVDFNASISGQRLISDSVYREVISLLSKYRLGIHDVEPDILGRAYEYLLRKFAEGSGQSAGEFYTPKEVAMMMAYILDPEPGNEIYDPCCGSGGLLIKCRLVFKEKYDDDPQVEPLLFYGQEINHITYAMAKMNVFIHDMEAEIALGNTMENPAFRNRDGSLKKFDLVIANPMWNQEFSESIYLNDPFKRFVFGIPPQNTADWGWIQHMFASLKDKGRMAVVLDTGAVSRGSGSEGKNKEREIRKAFVEKDLIEAVILLPENLFYNTTAPGIIIVINRNKKPERVNKILLINLSEMYEKGRPKNYLTENGIKKAVEIYREWKEEEGISKIITKEEAARNDYNLSPSRYVSNNNKEDVLPLDEAIVELEEVEEEAKEIYEKLKNILKSLRGLP